MSQTSLFTPLRAGAVTLQHRIVMAPMTRLRASDEQVPQEIAAEYYSQRASLGGLLITEGTPIAEEASVYPNCPGVSTPEQVAGWKQVTDRVHAKGGFIFLQLAAMGRADPPSLLEQKGFPFVSSGNVPMEKGGVAPTPLSKDEIYRYAALWAKAARSAVFEAGFDGVELHNANGYLLDQFLQSTANNRTDEFGGSIENRSRFTLLVLKSVTDAIGAERTAIRFSPYSTFQGMRMPDDEIVPQFSHVLTSIRDQHPTLAYVHFVESRVAGDGDKGEHQTEGSVGFARRIWGNREGSAFLSAGGYTLDSARERVAESGGAIVFGRAFIANPDLPLRFKYEAQLNKYDRSTFYGGAAKGYTDYPYSTDLVGKA